MNNTAKEVLLLFLMGIAIVTAFAFMGIEQYQKFKLRDVAIQALDKRVDEDKAPIIEKVILEEK